MNFYVSIICLTKNMKLVIVNDNNKITHRIGEDRKFISRHIRQPLRDDIGKELRDVKYPSKMYHEKLKDCDSESFNAGNLSTVGASKAVFKQIKNEYVNQSYRDKDFIKSIMDLKDDYANTYGDSIKGYIQFYSLNLFVIGMWTQTDVELFHKIASKAAIFCDATGSICNKIDDKVLYYYSFVQKEIGITCEPVPVLQVLTNCHNGIPLRWCLDQFLEDERLRFGHQTKSIPPVMVCDLSWPIIKMFLKCFNNESLVEYIQRSHTILVGKATLNDLSDKSFLHIC